MKLIVQIIMKKGYKLLSRLQVPIVKKEIMMRLVLRYFQCYNNYFKLLLQGSDVELDYDGSDEEDAEPIDAAACNVDNSFYPIYEASMKMKYTGHRNARYVCLNYFLDMQCLFICTHVYEKKVFFC